MDFSIGGIEFFAALGFLFAAYAVVGNDALQTLGTFINSNSRLHWFWLFAFAGLVLVATFTYGWVINDGDPSWGRLVNTSKYPVVDIQWYHTLPPLVLLIITRFGVPVSTSFMVLTVFATLGGLTSMLQKSLIGYGLAFVVGLLVYLAISRTLERHFRETELGDHAPWGLATAMGAIIGLVVYVVPPMISPDIRFGVETCITIAVLGVVIDVIASMTVIRFDNAPLSAAISAAVCVVGTIGALYFLPESFALFGLTKTPLIIALAVLTFGVLYYVSHHISSGRMAYWTILQWVTTGYLWGVWLIQDFANIFVFLPRELNAGQGFAGLLAILGLLAYTFWNKGGPVQRILQSKTAVTDIRSATVIDFIYASLLFFFKEVSDIPMSTTFVFLGLIAGREFGFTLISNQLNTEKAMRLSLSDASKAYIGLVISINMAVGLPLLARALTETSFNFGESLPAGGYLTFLLIANALLLPVAMYLRNPESKPYMAINGGLLASAAA
ncbi:MAG: hypothetical protein AAFQ67_07045, partial [Pseudomonadota bacterium]